MPAQDATIALQAGVLQPITGVLHRRKPQLLCGAVSELALENIYRAQAGIQAVVNARGNLTVTMDKLQHFQPNIYRRRIKKLF